MLMIAKVTHYWFKWKRTEKSYMFDITYTKNIIQL